MDQNSALQNLTRHCSAWLRPVRAWEHVLVVHIDLQLQTMLDVDEKQERVHLSVLLSQRWRDYFVSWDPSAYGGMTRISLPASWVWTPDTLVREAVTEERQGEPFVSLSSTGSVTLVEQLRLDLRCDLLMFLFPFDKQTCNLTLGSNLHTAQEMLLVPEDAKDSWFIRSQSPVLHGEWELLSVQSYTFNETQGPQSYSRITFQVQLQRYSLFYVVNLLLPSALVMVVDLASFAIPVDSAERLPFKITLLFGYTVFLLLVAELLPPFRDTTPMLGLYLVVCLAFLSLTMGESVLLLSLGQPDLLDPPCRLHRLAAFLCPYALKNSQCPPGKRMQGVAKGLRQAFGPDQPTGCSGGHDCMVQALAEELRDVTEELRILTQRHESRRQSLLLMEAMDRICFRIYLLLLSILLVSLAVVWNL